MNGTDLLLQPERGRWMIPKQLDTDGNNRPLYPGVWQFEMYWGLMSHAEYEQIFDFWEGTSASGTVVVELPEFAGTAYSPFRGYTGCTLTMPEEGPMFEEYIQNVTMQVLNVRR